MVRKIIFNPNESPFILLCICVMYLMNDRLYLYFGIVSKNEKWTLKDGTIWTIADDNGFAGKVGKLIGRCYCRLLPEVSFHNIAKNKIGVEFGWLIWNTEISYYYNNS